MSLLTLLRSQSAGQSVALPVSRVTLVAVPASVTAGAVSRAVPSAAVRLVAVAPGVTQATIVAIPASRVTLGAIAPARTTTVTRAVPVVTVWFRTVAPTPSVNVITVAVTPVAIRLLSQAPFVSAYIPVQVARVTLQASAPSVTGGGGGGVVVIPRAGGEGRGSVTKQP
jgi:hypothetical protein